MGLCLFQNIPLGSIVLPKRQTYGFNYKNKTATLRWLLQSEGGTLHLYFNTKSYNCNVSVDSLILHTNTIHLLMA